MIANDKKINKSTTFGKIYYYLKEQTTVNNFLLMVF